MKLVTICLALLVSSGAFSQSKKKQIESLQHRLDSIALVNDNLQNEKDRSDQKVKFYQSQIEHSQEQLKALKSDYELLVKECDQLEKKEVKKEERKTNTTNSQVDNPFGPGGTKGGRATSTTTGSGGSRTEFGSGIGASNHSKRVRLNHVRVDDIEIHTNMTIHYKLTIDADGNVVQCLNQVKNPDLADMDVVNKIGDAIQEQVKYNKSEGAPLVYQYYTVSVKANKQ